MADTTELELQLLDLEEKYNVTRDPVEKANIACAIGDIKAQISSTTLEHVAVVQREAPIRADHVETETKKRAMITNSGDTFRASL